MTRRKGLIIEPLASHHDRLNFSCGVDSLDKYLKKQANQDVRRRISRVFVVTSIDSPETVVGFYTLSTLSIELSHLPADQASKLPRHPVPAALIGRLACASNAAGKGIGGMLLADAIKRTLAVSDEIAIFAIVVDALNEQAANFYAQYGFESLTTRSRRMFLPLKSI